MTRITPGRAQGELAEMLERVASKRERFVIQRRGKVLAALVPAEDLAVLEKEELADRRDASVVKRRLSRRKETSVPLERGSKMKTVKQFTATPQQKRALAAARRNLARGDYLTLHELRRSLEAGR